LNGKEKKTDPNRVVHGKALRRNPGSTITDQKESSFFGEKKIERGGRIISPTWEHS
jgi:hypothetical protein